MVAGNDARIYASDLTYKRYTKTVEYTAYKGVEEKDYEAAGMSGRIETNGSNAYLDAHTNYREVKYTTYYPCSKYLTQNLYIKSTNTSIDVVSGWERRFLTMADTYTEVKKGMKSEGVPTVCAIIYDVLAILFVLSNIFAHMRGAHEDNSVMCLLLVNLLIFVALRIMNAKILRKYDTLENKDGFWFSWALGLSLPHILRFFGEFWTGLAQFISALVFFPLVLFLLPRAIIRLVSLRTLRRCNSETGKRKQFISDGKVEECEALLKKIKNATVLF